LAPTIVAIGGGSLSEERDGKQIEDYILGLANTASPRVCFIPTASGEVPQNIVRFYDVFTADRCRPSHLTLINRKVADLRGFLLHQDVIYVGGGNTAAMLAIWRQHGVDEVLREAWRQGTILCGSSAGGICWHDGGVTDSFGLPLQALNDGLGFIPGSFCPHYDAEATRRPVYRMCVAEGLLQAGLAADNCVGVRYDDRQVAEIVASTPTARAWRLEKASEGFSESEIVPRYLGA